MWFTGMFWKTCIKNKYFFFFFFANWSQSAASGIWNAARSYFADPAASYGKLSGLGQPHTPGALRWHKEKPEASPELS